MLFATVGQWKVFLAMMVAGLLAGGVYDLLAALRHLLRAAVGELKKNEIVVVREELREYADLLDTEED